MASTIKVDNVQNQPGTNIVSKCSVTTTIGAGAGETVNVCAATVNLGRSGGTVNLTCGASQTGFGRTGTVDWDTSIHTGTVTAATGKGYFVNTTSGGITVNLPAAAVGSIVAVSDYASTAASNNITIAPNGSEKINGINDNYYISTAGLAVTLVYADATRGWKSVTGSDADATGEALEFVAATGGTPCAGATCGDYKIHTFTGPGTLCVSCAGNAAGNNQIEYLVVAGGGAGGGQYIGGGGGAGGFRFASPSIAPLTYPAKPLAGTTITAAVQGYPIAVGGGGAGNGSAGASDSCNGLPSTFSTIVSAGGGFGKQDQIGYAPPSPNPRSPSSAGNGGSGGGASTGCSGSYGGGNGNCTPTSPAQGSDGGDGNQNPIGAGKGAVGNWVPGSPSVAGGGGGAMDCGAVGNKCGPKAGDGGVGGGIPSAFGTSGEPNGGFYYFAGGGGGTRYQGSAPQLGTGGLGGAGNAVADPPGGNGVAGTCNTGGGGGGTDSRPGPYAGGNGGSGIVIIRYKFQ